MRLRTDDRAVTVQIGTVLLFAVLIILLSTYQASVVPQQNEQVEFNHNQQVQGQLQDLRDGLLGTAAAGSGGSTSVALGTQYPVRAFFVNPAPPSGSLRTTPPANVTVENATAVGETGDYWDGSARNFSTRGFVYEPLYHVYQNPPDTVYDNGVLYNRFDGANRTLAGQRLVRENTISLVAVNGTLAESGSGTASVDHRAVSPATRTVTVRNESHNVSVVVPTALPADEWEDLLAGELNQSEGDDRYVLGVEEGPRDGTVRVVLEPGVYELRLAKVGVGTDVSGVSPHYVTDVAGDNTSVASNSTRKLVVEIRDRYNNPVSGARVNLSLVDNTLPDRLVHLGESGETLTDLRTDAEGRVEVRYEVDEFNGQNRRAKVRASIADAPPTTGGFADGARENLTFGLTVYSVTGGGGGGGGGGDTLPANAVAYDDANGNGQYDDGEQAYTEGNLKSFDRTGVDLVIAKAVSVNKLDAKADTITVEADLTVTGGNDLTLTARQGALDAASGTTLTGPSVALYGQQVALDGAGVEATSGSVTVKADRGSGGPVSAAGATVQSAGAVELVSTGDVDLSGATLDAAGQATANLNKGSYRLTVADARLLDADDTLVYDPNGVTVEGTPAEGSVSKN